MAQLLRKRRLIEGVDNIGNACHIWEATEIKNNDIVAGKSIIDRSTIVAGGV